MYLKLNEEYEFAFNFDLNNKLNFTGMGYSTSIWIRAKVVDEYDSGHPAGKKITLIFFPPPGTILSCTATTDGVQDYNYNGIHYQSVWFINDGAPCTGVRTCTTILAAPAKVNQHTGEFCIDCGEHYPYAAKNHINGLVCYSCRQTPTRFWKFEKDML